MNSATTTLTHPATWTNWSTATYNTDVGNNDEYKGSISGLSTGTYYYNFRYKNGPCDYVYGGYNGGFGMELVMLMVFYSALRICTFSIHTNDLLAWFPMNGDPNDYKGNNNNGTLDGPSVANDRNGNSNSAYSFDGSNDLIYNIPDLDVTTDANNDEFSAVAWIKTSNIKF